MMVNMRVIPKKWSGQDEEIILFCTIIFQVFWVFLSALYPKKFFFLNYKKIAQPLNLKNTFPK